MESFDSPRVRRVSLVAGAIFLLAAVIALMNRDWLHSFADLMMGGGILLRMGVGVGRPAWAKLGVAMILVGAAAMLLAAVSRLFN
jgi:hypothetical protein